MLPHFRGPRTPWCRAAEIWTRNCYSLRAFAEQEGFQFPLLSDFWPHGEVALAYGVFDEVQGRAVRGTFLVDTRGTVRWTMINSPGEARPLAAYREALAAL